MTLSRTLVRRSAELRAARLPDAVAHAARLHLLDAIGVGLAASQGAQGQAYRTFAAGLPARGPATLFGAGRGAGAADAALVNGGLIHSLEFDDTHTESIVHGSAVLAPAALAVAEAHGASGGAMLGSYARAWEMLIRVGLAARGRFQQRGFQVTSVGGAMAAALIAAELSGLAEDQSVAALGIALSQGSGVFEFLSNGSSVKSLHPGWAAHGGVIAAQFAKAGMGGPETAFEGRFGLFTSFAGAPDAADAFGSELADLGTHWRLPDAAFKFHPCCHYLHPFIEAAGRLAEDGVRADRVETLLCRAPAGAAPIVCEPWGEKSAPPTSHAARWSLPVAVAARLVDGRVDLATFEDPLNPAALALAQRIRWEPLAEDRFPQAFEAEIVCVTADGQTRTVRIDDVYGNRNRPAGDAAVRAKFRANAGLALSAESVAALEAAIDHLDEAPDLRAVTAALRGPSPAL
ncbi:MmgE/PrpD family protein [Alsobacter soli]|uniref:MmgE/PrpD family protein n=1 Tax=Alsobacter soli TaxID=2109933 RepID=A0A2T1HUZ2_9HYPH|nr:MmgE/PrpD family protein [Alsobacter soli]PSC05467.1 MmgE/PrpD family protein [Alsobacter soli]